jgi:hypothetical protein
MKWQSNLGNIIRQNRRDSATDEQNKINNLMKAAEFGKSIWDSVNEQNKYKPGSDFYNLAKEQSVGWPSQLADKQQSLSIALDENRARLNEAKAAGDQTRALALQEEQNRLLAERERLEREGSAYRARLAAGDKTTERQNNMMSAIQEAFGTAQVHPGWFMPDPNNPASNIINPEKIGEIRDNIMLAIKTYRPTAEDMAVLQPYIENLLASPSVSGTQESAKDGAGVDFNSIFKNIAATARNRSVPQYQKTGVAGLSAKEWMDKEKSLEGELSSIIPLLQGEDKTVAENALSQSAATGQLGEDKYATLWLVLQRLKEKLQGVTGTRSTEGQGTPLNPKIQTKLPG